MKTKHAHLLRHFWRDNRGSGIVVVLVSMLCVALMGASLLFLSYTGLRLKTTERQAARDFYSAETAMEEIRAGVQTAVSGAIATSYKYALETYSSGAHITDRFEERFREDLKKAGLFTNGGTSYDIDALADFVTDPAAITVETTSGGLVVENAVEDTLVLRGIQVTHTAANGYTTQLSTDLTISMPEFAYIMSATSISGLPQHALIARDALQQNIGMTTIEIDGSAYAGRMLLGGNAGSKMTIAKGTLVCAGEAQVSGSTADGRLVTENPVKFWAGRIAVDGGSTAVLGGETRVLDDLELAGSRAGASLSGSYYGFGDGTSDDGSRAGQANRSSAILVNGLNSTLDVSGLNRLMLAGRSYISDSLYAGAMSEGKTVEMLESVAVRSTQQMYLIDPGCLTGVGQNPAVTAASEPAASLNAEGQALAAAYDFSLRHLQYFVPGGSQKITYYFMEFRDPTGANDYFESWFAENSSQMNSYLSAGSDLNASGSNTLGYTIRGRDGTYAVSRPTGVTFDCTGMRSTFNQLKKTLIDSNTLATASNPYEYIVDTGRVRSIDGSLTFADESGVVIGLVTDGDYTIDGSRPELRMIIADGDVTVERSFRGLVICGGTIHIHNSVTMEADEGEVLRAFNSVNTEDPSDLLRSYLANGVGDGGGIVDPGGEDGWELNSLVTYRNWTKN